MVRTAIGYQPNHQKPRAKQPPMTARRQPAGAAPHPAGIPRGRRNAGPATPPTRWSTSCAAARGRCPRWPASSPRNCAPGPAAGGLLVKGLATRSNGRRVQKADLVRVIVKGPTRAIKGLRTLPSNPKKQTAPERTQPRAQRRRGRHQPPGAGKAPRCSGARRRALLRPALPPMAAVPRLALQLAAPLFLSCATAPPRRAPVAYRPLTPTDAHAPMHAT
jgi:hypothetical protein